MSQIIAAYAGCGFPAAIGIIRVSGEGSAKLLEQVFSASCGTPVSGWKASRLYHGRLHADGAPIDICMACIFRAPRSYTGEEMAEIHIHGSKAVAAAALDLLCAKGARHAEPGEFTKRAFLNGKLDLTAAEATADLIHSVSAAAAKNAAAQLEGGLGEEMDAMRSEVLGICAHFDAVCDYPDEDLDPFLYSASGARLAEIGSKLERLAASHEKGRYLERGLPVAVTGRPNVGKSSLFNALAGSERAIVTDEAGTTRDIIEYTVNLGGALVRLLDTAGLRTAEGRAEEIGIEKAMGAAMDSAAVLAVFDDQPVSEDHLALLRKCAGKPMAAVFNKTDLGLPEPKLPEDIRFDRVFRTSALTGDGTEELAAWLSSLCTTDEETVITSARQAALMASAAADLKSAAQAAEAGMTPDAFLADARRASVTMGKITGRESDPDMASEIFKRFCVGK